MNYIKGFNGLRAVSILLVLFNHLGLFDFLQQGDFLKTRIWMVISGNTGVNIFFVLSGFLISRILQQEKKEKFSISFKNFYARRFLRLLPPLILFYVITAILIHYRFLESTNISFSMSVFYLYNFIPWKYYVIEFGHTWSLGVEEQFYLIWPWIIHFLSKSKVILVAFVLILLCILAKVLLPNIILDNGHLLSADFNTDRWFIPAIAPIMCGAIFAILMNFSFIQKYFGSTILLVFSVTLFLSPLYFTMVLLPFSFIAQAIGIGILITWMFYNQESAICTILEAHPIAYIGKISYGIYVYQGLFLRTGPGGTLLIQKFPLNIFLTFITAILSYELIEKKVLKIKKRYR